MRVAVLSNYKTTYKALSSLEGAFTVAYRGGTVMGFSLVGLALGILAAIIIIYKRVFHPTSENVGELMD